jgi:hypothetical protein
MGARTARSTQRIRLLALVTALLTALAMLSPLLSHGMGLDPHPRHGAEVVSVPTVDQGTAAARVDQPAVLVPVAARQVTLAASTDDEHVATERDRTAVETIDPRGPPGGR